MGTVIILIGAGVGIWGVVNLLEGYGNDNPGAKSQGMKQFVAGVGIVVIGVIVPKALQGLFDKAVA
ncbi:MAG: Maff2 family protein [Eubacterium sp.]|nr:Maff2 family protein [Eubacterium sp.]